MIKKKTQKKFKKETRNKIYWKQEIKLKILGINYMKF